MQNVSSSESNKRIVHIDGDIIVYSVGFAANDDPVENALHSVKVLIKHILVATEADEYVVHLTGKGNFRNDLATIQGYKANRKDAAKPVHYDDIRNYLINHWGAFVTHGQEADDTIGIEVTRPSEHTQICASLDKDLDMIVGEHYNWRKKEHYHVTPYDADRFFITQLLTGDSTDNIPGLKRITGQVASKKIKEYCTEPETFEECIVRVYDVYREHKPDLDVCSTLHEIGNLLWIRRYGYKTWEDYAATSTENESRREMDGEPVLGIHPSGSEIEEQSLSSEVSSSTGSQT
jgi:5'-3' exonuclease